MLESLIQKSKQDGKYHFFVLYCWALFPVNFAKHFWIVIIYEGEIYRLEVCHFKNRKNPELGYIHLNLVKPRSGLKKYLRKTKKYRKPYLAYHISGSKKSLAYKISHFIKLNYKDYKYTQKYNLFIGPNCNTFVQYMLNRFPEIKFKLPRNAFGENYN
ncbi:DUF3750 domain-containing protein [Candidatus Gracilibacteria bacterium]|nr:DUF3750 domain-containing protein [Candidatus Gracilibacteria bacterium]